MSTPRATQTIAEPAAGPAAGPTTDRPLLEEAKPRTHLPVRDDGAPPAVPRPALGAPNADELFVRIGAWVGAVGLAWLITQRFLPLPGVVWFVVIGFLCGLMMTALLTGMTGTRIEIKDRLAGSIVTAGAVIVALALVSAVAFVVLKGWRPVVHWNFWTQDMGGVAPDAPFDEGGIAHAIVGSAIQLGIALIITLPLGIGTAIFMTEVGGRFARIVRTVVEAMTALPSIVAGLFIYSVCILTLGMDRSGLCAGLAIGVMMLPIIARASDVVLRVVPGTLREASLALGASRWRTVWHVVLPTARPGLATAVILGIARGVGETSPVLLTSGATTYMNTNPFSGAMNSLPLFVYTNARSPEPSAVTRAFGAAFVLMLLVLLLFIIARLLARPRSNRNRPPLLRRIGGALAVLVRLPRRAASAVRRDDPPNPPSPPAPPTHVPSGSTP